MTQMTTKVIVSNKGALEALYGSNVNKVNAALKALIDSDQEKNIETRVVYLDDAAAMKKFKAQPVTDPGSEKENKKAIDGVYEALTPDYLVLLGSPDIIPHQDLTNPVKGDEDPNVPSDLPYASESAYSKTIRRFINPTRVVGRLTGITGSSDPAALVKAIETAAKLETRPRNLYSDYFAVSANVWKGSTTQSVTNIFGNAGALELVPPSGPDWTDDQLKARTHFVNCHGAGDNSNWYGQLGWDYPVAVKAEQIAGKISDGTIVAAECCYGAQLYNPEGVGGPGVCNTYLTSNCCAFCGSTTIAYGPADGQGAADLVTQYFIINLLNNCSVGRAMLEARQKFIQECSPLDPVDQKTIAQFILLGDPSDHPVFAIEPIVSAILSYVPESLLSVFKRRERRQKLEAIGKGLPSKVGLAKSAPKMAPKGSVLSIIEKIVKDIGLMDTVWESFEVVGGAVFKKAMAKVGAPETIHMVYGKQEAKDTPVPASTILIVKEQAGRLIAAKTLHRK